MRRRIAVALAVLAACAAGCNSPLGPAMSAQQAAQELNMDARFGQGAVAVDRIAPAMRDEFAAHHHGWGSAVRLADMELTGSRPRGDHDVDVFVRFAWYRVDDEELRYTTVKQGWREKNGGWILIAEDRTEGDVGLLGESVVYQTPASEPPHRTFPTVTLSQ